MSTSTRPRVCGSRRVGSRATTQTDSLPAFPYPLRPQYTGSGDVNDAQNYVPVLPTVSTNDDIDWIGRDQISTSQGTNLPSTGGPPVIPVVLVGGSIVVLLVLLVTRGLRALARQRS